MQAENLLIEKNEPVLVTGAAGFIGVRVVRTLLEKGFCNVRCLVRPTSNLKRLKSILDEWDANGKAEIVTGNLLSANDCEQAVQDVKVIYHLAAGTGTKSFADAYMNSVVTTRNLIEAALGNKVLKRFVNLSSFSVYTNQNPSQRGVLDETCPVEANAGQRAEAYCYAKVKQDELVEDYGKTRKLPYVHLRPGVVYGPGKSRIPGRVGVSTFGIFLHLGGPSQIPFTYVDNCAEAIVLAGLKPGIDGETMNIVDDDLPTSREFLQMYKRRVKRFKSLYVPHAVSWLMCYGWERYCAYSEQQLPPVFSRNEWWAYWKDTSYPNEKLKRLTGWKPRVSMREGLDTFFESCKERRA